MDEVQVERRTFFGTEDLHGDNGGDSGGSDPDFEKLTVERSVEIMSEHWHAAQIGILVACAYFKNKEGAYYEQTVYVMTDGKEQSAAITQAAVNQVVCYLLAEHDMDMRQLYMWTSARSGGLAAISVGSSRLDPDTTGSSMTEPPSLQQSPFVWASDAPDEAALRQQVGSSASCSSMSRMGLQVEEGVLSRMMSTGGPPGVTAHDCMLLQ
ncbi:hypothetical protein QJQ45_009068 [Haematococcus lacustris]|nr:hypothetical protein QJQ45_009068 [Haematococcus lacustris]